MDELKNLVNPKNVLQLSKSLQKIAKSIEDHKKEQGKLNSTLAELNFLKEQCLSKNIQLSLLSCQTLYGLIEKGVIEPASGLTTFITMISSASTPEQLTALAEGIINILLLDLEIAAMQSNAKKAPYNCPFGLKTAQHPIISLLQKKNYNVLDLIGKMDGIHNHSDEHISSNSLEFLRPVYSYIFCSPSKYPESLLVWNGFLECRSKSNGYTNLFYDIFRWSRITPEKHLNMAMQLVDAMRISLNDGKSNQANDFQMYLIALITTLLESGNDPRKFLAAIHRSIRPSPENQDLCDYNLISMSQIIHKIPAFYLSEALRIVKTLLEMGSTKNYIISNMILDALILQLAINGKSLPPKTVSELNRLIKCISKQKTAFIPTKHALSVNEILYFNPTIAFNWSLAKLSSRLCAELSNDETKILDHLLCIAKSNQTFSEELHAFLRGLLLSEQIKFDRWLQIFNQLLASARSNSDISNDTIYFVLYYLAKETDGKKQVELLRGLTAFGSVKQNIPLIMNTFRSLSTSNSIALRCLAIDLHTRLWHVENRTYQFLLKLLRNEETVLSIADQWEMNIAKAGAIRDICSENASLHGTDLVGPLSKILNNSIENDLARAWTLDAVISLCKSHTVNIVSTWKVLSGAFETKLGLRTTKSLCQFLGEVPLLKSPSEDYEKLYEDALQRLWSFVINSDVPKIIQFALLALRNFDFTALTLKHMPKLFYAEIHIPKEYHKQIEDSKSNADLKPLTLADVLPYIPGECWIVFLQKVNKNATESAIEFVSHSIENEMLQYRSGVYMLPEGRPEPNDMKQLHARSPLRAIIRYIKEQSEWNTEPTLAAKCLQCISKKYSRPMPPLNWFFLIEYMNHASKFENSTAAEQFEMKMQALKIASNQTAHSGSARNLIENYLQQFDADVADFDETISLLELVPNLCLGATPRILAAFLKNTLTFLYQHSLSSHFEVNCHFEQAIVALLRLFDQTQPTNENIDIVIDEFSKFNELLDSEMGIYDRYADGLLKLSSEHLERLTTPCDWNISRFRKVLKLRSMAIGEKKPYTSVINSWMWLNSVIDNVSDAGDPIADRERKEMLLLKISELLLKEQDDTKLCEWLAFFLGKVQANFTADAKNESLEHSLFCLDLFICCLVFTSGCSIFLADEAHSLENRAQWLNKLPEALWMLTKRKCWSEHMPRIFEFLYHLNQSTNLPKEYIQIACQSLVCVKNHEYFLQKNMWTKFISLKR